jgi:hypothetical protein
MEGTAQERLQKRLMSLWSELPDDEKELLLTVLARADEAQAEVSGFATDLSGVGLLGPDVQATFHEAVRKAGGDAKASGTPFLKFNFGTVFTTK